MTGTEVLLALAIGGILGALMVAVIYETSHRRHQRRATGPRTASHVEPEHQSTPTLPEPPEGDYPDGWVPLSRMTREEVRDHLARLAEMQGCVNRTLTNLDAVDWDRNRAVWRNTDPFLRSHAEWVRRTESNPLDALGYTPEPCPEDCVCGAGKLPLPTVRTVDLTPPEEE